MEGYVAAKARIFKAQGPEASALIGVDEAWGRDLAENLRAAGRKVITVDTANDAAGPDDFFGSAGLLKKGEAMVADLSLARSLP
ncbi:hypothetical protein LTR94_038152, partial [Friedmanniomyces endolithicus]